MGKQDAYQEIKLYANEENKEFYSLDKSLHKELDSVIRVINHVSRNIDNILLYHEKIKGIIRYNEITSSE